MNALQTIADLIAANQADTVRTPYLDVSWNALRTAHDQLVLHGKEVERLAASKAADIAAKQKELAQLQAEAAAMGADATAQATAATK